MLRISGLVLVVMIAAMIVGCSAKPHFWYKEGVLPEDAHTALAECKYQVGLSGVSRDQQEGPVAECMQNKGFKLYSERTSSSIQRSK